MAGTVDDISDENYASVIASPAAVVAYGISACEACNALDPVLAEAAQRYPQVRFGKAKMHVPGRCREIKKTHTFETYPTVHLFSGGNLIMTREGKLELAELTALINDHLLNH
jgi:thiol-disulfide isomerase/thioredoxin